jgi:putative restriction endonuclease
MGYGVFVHKEGSGYFDVPWSHYQFPKTYRKAAQAMVGNWIVYYEPVKPPPSKGFFAVAKVEAVVPDPERADHYRALIEQGSFLNLEPSVPHRIDGQRVERDLSNAQLSVRPLSNADFSRIVSLGLPNDDTLPRVGEVEPMSLVREEQTPFEVERPLVQTLLNRPFRDRAFRRAVLHAYEGRCAVTGWRLVNGGGRLVAEAAHIRPVEHGGPDSIRNGLALSGTAHWMFDRGLIGVADNHEIIIHRKVNDRSGVEAIINSSGKLIAPLREADRPHPQFLSWHREFHAFAA